MSRDESKGQGPYATFAMFNASGLLTNVTEVRTAMTPNYKLPYLEFSTVDPISYNYTDTKSYETYHHTFTHVSALEILMSKTWHQRNLRICKNSPKNEHIDYVTYCFGTAGTWFGFCFLILNPVNFIPKSLLATDDQDHAIQGEDTKPTRMTRRSLDTESRYSKFKIIDSQLNILFTKMKELERGKQKNVDRGKQKNVDRGKQKNVDRGKQKNVERGKQKNVDRGKISSARS